MGLESLVDRELQRACSGLVRGEDYWFWDGLRVESEEVGKKIIEILEKGDQFGPGRLTFVPESEKSPNTDLGRWVVEFGIHRNHWRFDSLEYNIYARNFKAGVEDADC